MGALLLWGHMEFFNTLSATTRISPNLDTQKDCLHWLDRVKLEISFKAPVVAIQHPSWKVLEGDADSPPSSRAADPEIWPPSAARRGSNTCDYYCLRGALTLAWLCVKDVEFHEVTLLEKTRRNNWMGGHVVPVLATAAARCRNLSCH